MHYFIIPLVLIAAIASYLSRKLTPAAATSGFVVATACYVGGGVEVLCALAAFFILSTIATSIGKRRKMLLEKESSGPRKTSQVLANGGLAAICSVLIIVIPEQQPLLHLAAFSALSSATADTVSSEIGNVFGSRFINILTFQPGQRGVDGSISVEGTLAGIAGSIVIACIGWKHAIIIGIAGTIGNLMDSYLGAKFERKGILGNDQVNFLNTVAAALSAIGMHSVFG